MNRFLIRKGEHLARIERGEYKSCLLERSHGLDITYELIPANVTFYMDSAAEWPGFEFVHILSGELAFLRDGKTDQEILTAGSSIARHAIPTRSYFKSTSPLELLHICSPPSFDSMADENADFHELASLLETDEYVNGHCKRLESLAVRVGELLGLAGEQLGNLSFAAFFHDIGKSRVPESILHKPARLTNEEYAIVKKHSEWGKQILAAKPFLRPASLIVEQVHERVDGNGYPQGLSASSISLEARIVAVVDAFDAMTTPRPYRQCLSDDDALAELAHCAGTQFDPDVVRTFSDVILQEGHIQPSTEMRWAAQDVSLQKQRQAFLQLGEAILQDQSVDAILHRVVQGVRNVTVFNAATILLLPEPTALDDWERDRSSFTMWASAGLPKPLDTADLNAFTLLPTLLTPTYQTGTAYRIPLNAIPEAPRVAFSKLFEIPPTTTSTINVVPMCTSGKTVHGFLLAGWPAPPEFVLHNVFEPMQMFANLAAIAVIQTRNREKMLDALQELETAATTDALTGLQNRRFLFDYLELEEARARRERYPVSILIMDLVDFRKVNNDFGHLEGDRALQAIATAMRSVARAADPLVRYGGDEFVVVMPKTRPQGAISLAKRMSDCIAKTDLGFPFQLGIRTGHASWCPPDDRTLYDVLREADTRMCKHASQGRHSLPAQFGIRLSSVRRSGRRSL